MPKTEKTYRRVPRSKSGVEKVIGRSGPIHVDGVSKTPRGNEVWRIRSGNYVVNVITSGSSTAVMDDAVKIYSPALKRLAKR
jgi:mRNA-degrading endonuclease RelE of RelBE toxin-antitoxin system